MRRLDQIPNRYFILGSLFVTTNRLDTLMDKVFKDFNMTTKQWFLSIIVDSLFDSPPTMQEAAKQMGCSHQNVKQVALKLKENDLLKMEKDENDKRITRMSLTEKSDKLFEDIVPAGDEFLDKVFAGVEKEQMDAAREMFAKMMDNIEKMEHT